jgi:hypothetical protein
MTTTVVRFWVEETDFSDLNAGMIEWSDGTTVFAIDVLKDPEHITRVEYLFMVDQLAKHMIGLVSIQQISWLYQGMLNDVIGTDWVEQEARGNH